MNERSCYTAADLIEWVRERYDNCIRIAAQKTGDERAGWMEDAAYFEAIINALSAAEPGITV